MGRRRPVGRRLRGGSDARQMIDAIVAAGVPRGDIGLTGNGHLSVACPDGTIVHISSKLGDAGVWKTARANLAEHGVRIPARGGGGNRGNRQRSRAPRPGTRYSATVTRCADGESYAMATGDDGTTWFISRWYLSPAAELELACGRRVTFTGNPLPGFGSQHPSAYGVRVLPGQEEELHERPAGLAGVTPGNGAERPGEAQRGTCPEGSNGNLPVLPPGLRRTPAVAAAFEAAAAVKYGPRGMPGAVAAYTAALRDDQEQSA